MPSRTLWFLGLFPVLLAAQRSPGVVGVDRQVISAALWAEARYNYAYWDAVRANWDSAFVATVTFTNAHPAPTDLQFVERLHRWGALLNDGQLEILPAPAVANRVARPPLALRSIERRPFIMDYAVNDEMRVARPERLAEILTVQGVPVADWIRDSVLPDVPGSSDASRWERAILQMLDGERGTALHLSLKLPGGAERGASVTRSISLTSRWPLAPPSLQADTLPDGVIWVRIGTLDDPAIADLLDRALGDAPREGLRHRGLILDLRETSEGTRQQGYVLLSRLTDHPLLAPRHRTPFYDLDSLRWLGTPPDTIWPPTRRERIPYTGPVVMLSSPRTAGAAEELLMAFHAGSRGAIIGETSAGSVGETAILPLAAGWKLRVTVSRAAYPDGREIERSGIVPDIPVEVRVQDVLAGRDAVLDRARAYLSETARR